METTRLTVTTEEAGQRADSLLARRLEGLTRSAAARLLEEGRVTDRGRPVAKNLRVQPGQVLEVTLPEPEEPEARPQDIPLDVVYEDEDVIVVNKPTGMVVHPAPGHPDGTLVNALLYHCGESLSGVGGQKRPGIVHRIDRDTSGLIIAAKNDAAHLALAAQLADHTLARTYECLAVGNFREDSGTVNAPIGRHPVDRKRMAVVRQGGREAVTHWEVIARYPGVTHLRCRLETGPPDPGPPGPHRPPDSGGYGVWGQKARAGADGPVSPRRGAAVSPSPHRGAGGADLPFAGGVCPDAGQAPAGKLTPPAIRWKII